MVHLYPISPPQINLPDFAEDLKRVLANPHVGLFQLRLKNVSDDEILRAAEILLPICRAYKVPFIINDSLELAIKSGADGLHVGEDDGDIAAARNALGQGRLIGASCYNSIEKAQAAVKAGADHVSFGAFFPTITKQAKSRAEVSTIIRWKEISNIPCCAIGGINPDNCQPIVDAGADYICMISAIWN